MLGLMNIPMQKIEPQTYLTPYRKSSKWIIKQNAKPKTIKL